MTIFAEFNLQEGGTQLKSAKLRILFEGRYNGPKSPGKELLPYGGGVRSEFTLPERGYALGRP